MNAREDDAITGVVDEQAEEVPVRRARRHRRRRGRLRRRIPPVSVIPTLMTLGNLVAGFTAIHYASKPIVSDGPFGWSGLTLAGTLIFVGMVLDALDGSVARLTHSFSDIGAQIDSLADLVTFGVAPAFMMLRLVSYWVDMSGVQLIPGPDTGDTYIKVLWGVAAVYVCCTALRLARFNVETPSATAEDHLVFRGLPSPGAAGAVAGLIVLHQYWLYRNLPSPEDASLTFARWTAFGIPLVTLLCAVAMVSSIPYVHVVNRYVRGRRTFAYTARLIIPLILLLWWRPLEVLALGFTFYVVYSPLRMTISRLRRRSARARKPAEAG